MGASRKWGWRPLWVAVVLACSQLAPGPGVRPIGSAQGQTGDVVLENLQLTFGGISYRAPRAEFRGTTLSRDELARIFDQNAPGPVLERVRRLNASSIVLPEIVSEVMTPQGRQVTTYRDTVISSVSDGRIGSVSARGGTISATDGKSNVTGSFDRFGLDELDLALAVNLFFEKGEPNAPLQRVYGGFTLDGLTMTDPSGVTTRIGRIAGRDLSARPTTAGWLETFNTFAAQPDLKEAPPEVRKRALASLVELFDAFSIGNVEATDITFQGKDGAGRINRIAFAGTAASRAGEIRFDGIEVGSAENRVKVATLSMGGLSFKPMFELMLEMGDDPKAQPSPAALRRLIPSSISYNLTGLEVDITGDETGKQQPLKLALGRFEFAADKPVENIPTDIRMGLRNLAFAIPANPDNEGLKQIATLGYNRVDASFALGLAWNEAGQELVIREVSVEGQDMGSVLFRAVLGNVTRDIFNPDTAVASVAALGATAKSAEITIDNRGLFERVIASAARNQNRNPEDIRREYGMAAAVGIPAVLGNSGAAKMLSQAVSKFVAKPGRLVVRARAKQPTGFGVADFAANPNPAGILNSLEITATAE